MNPTSAAARLDALAAKNIAHSDNCGATPGRTAQTLRIRARFPGWARAARTAAAARSAAK
jgi:hypothetical protein